MGNYYVNDTPQPTGEREVHLQECWWLGQANSKTHLGHHATCRSAVTYARSIYGNVDGCAHCIPQCHTR
ncbi:hypothetical protein C1H69_13605 [Billgrantia endophytica]|uniref:Uncharacterized protein n=1 Tax=Billgrantia endophytica TaxID=2033802 RepID=A0A2N7U1J1_9GAMM|nr:hypothetical protein C1H69_13605 [Halomonas endophytica]